MTSQNCFLSSCSGKNSPVLLAVLSTGLQVGREKVKFNKISSDKSEKNQNATLTGADLENSERGGRHTCSYVLRIL